jgi:hypothetical protein
LGERSEYTGDCRGSLVLNGGAGLEQILVRHACHITEYLLINNSAGLGLRGLALDASERQIAAGFEIEKSGCMPRAITT